MRTTPQPDVDETTRQRRRGGRKPSDQLDARQMRMALHYAIHGNVSHAAKHVGFDRRHVQRLLKRPHIAEFVRRVREGLAAAGERAKAAGEEMEWARIAVHARELIHALVTGALREIGVDPRLLRVELDAAREAILRAEGAVPQTVLLGEMAHMDRIRRMSDAELDQFLVLPPEEQAQVLGIERLALLPATEVEPREQPAAPDFEVVEEPDAAG